MPRSREGWLSTIRAISEMTEANGCTKAEAATARVKAFELMYRKGISVRDLCGPDPPRSSESFRATPESCKPARPFIRQVFPNEKGKGTFQDIVSIFAICGIAALTVWTMASVLNPESRGYHDPPQSAYHQTEVHKLGAAHSALPDILSMPERVLYSDP
jgi:hypothetical protein